MADALTITIKQGDLGWWEAKALYVRRADDSGVPASPSQEVSPADADESVKDSR